jgi:hypothetical protein
MTLGVQAGVEWTDNANMSSTFGKQDYALAIGPLLNGELTMPVVTGGREEVLTLSSSVGFSYKRWMNGGQANQFTSPIGVVFALPLHISNWDVFVNDSFTFTNDPLETTLQGFTSATPSALSQYSNLGSISAMRRFGRFALTLATQRQDKWAPLQPSLEETIYSFSITTAVYLQDNLSVFWANSIGFVFPADHTTRSEGINMTTSIGLAGQITPVLSGTVSIGYVHSEFDPILTTKGAMPGGRTDGISGNVGLAYAHPLRPNTTHALSVTYSPGVTAMLNQSNFQTTYGANYTITHRLNSYLTFSPSLGWMRTISEGGLSHSQYDALVIQMGFNRAFGRRLSGSLLLRHEERSSSQGGMAYNVNDVTTSLSYMF